MFALLLAAIGRLRAVFRHRVVDPLLDPHARISKARFLRMLETMFVSEARLRREIFETALNLLGASQQRHPLGAFRLPRPSSPAEIGRRFACHARMSASPDWYAWRLARRLRKMVRAERYPLRLLASHASTSPTSWGRQKVEGLVSATHVGEADRTRSVRDGGGLQPRAPPFPPNVPIAS
ncbi:MAG: hypothetical protein ABI740_00200 [Alphaproteobacteria bacterium]